MGGPYFYSESAVFINVLIPPCLSKVVNVLFVAKYSARISDTLALCATLLAVVSYYVLCRYVQWKALGGRVAFVLCLICFAVMLVLPYCKTSIIAKHIRQSTKAILPPNAFHCT